MPELKEEDLVEGGAGVRAQACDRNGGLSASDLHRPLNFMKAKA